MSAGMNCNRLTVLHDVAHAALLYILHTWKHPADWEFGLGASTFHTAFYQELIVSGEESTIMIHLLQNKVIFNLNVAHLY